MKYILGVCLFLTLGCPEYLVAMRAQPVERSRTCGDCEQVSITNPCFTCVRNKLEVTREHITKDLVQLGDFTKEEALQKIAEAIAKTTIIIQRHTNELASGSTEYRVIPMLLIAVNRLDECLLPEQ